jgi:hypothetical protein
MPNPQPGRTYRLSSYPLCSRDLCPWKWAGSGVRISSEVSAVTGGVRMHLRQNGESHEPDLGVTPSHHRASIRHPARTADCCGVSLCRDRSAAPVQTQPRSALLPEVYDEGHCDAVRFRTRRRVFPCHSRFMVGWGSLVYAMGGAYIVVVMAEWTVHSAPSGHWSMCTSCDLGWPGRCSSFPWLPPGLSTDGSLVWPH